MQQKIIVTALPNGYGSRGGAGKRLSAAISLQVTDASTTLAAVNDMLHWAELLSTAKWVVMQNDVPVEAKVVSAKIDTELWKNLFNPKIKVNAFVAEDLAGIPILSYPVKHIVGYINSVVEKTGNQYADKLPDATYYTDNNLFAWAGMYKVGDFNPDLGREKPSLKALVKPNTAGLGRIQPMLNKNKYIPFSRSAAPETDLTQLRMFHGLYDTKKAVYKKPVQPNFEFHQVLSVLSSYPQLMRRLGLVVDLEINNPGGAITLEPANGTIRAIPTGINFTTATSIICPPTAYNKTERGFYARPQDGSSLIDKGYLKLNTEAFTVFQLDTDGSALKLGQQIDSLTLKKAKQQYHALEGKVPNAATIPFFGNDLPRREGLPANRTAGIGIAKNGMAEILNKKFVRMNALVGSIAAPGLAVPATVTSPNANYKLSNDALFADDINLGYRMDVQDREKPTVWYSLHFRSNGYSYVPPGGSAIPINNTEPDEGFIQISAAENGEGADKHLKVGETFARWEGWSLSVPRPGLSLNDPMIDKTPASSQSAEDAKYKKPGNVDFTLQVTPAIKPGTLPMLRFGKQYAIKIRTVDLAGNSVSHTSIPENDSESIVKNILYKRYEPAGAPFLVMGNDVKDGESSEQVVIRTMKDASSAESAAFRFVKPPRCTVQMAELHKLFDKAFGDGNKDAAIAIRNKIIAKDPSFDAAKTSSKLEVFKGAKMEVEYLADPMAAGVTFYISDTDPNPKIPNPDVFMRRVSFYLDPEVNDANANDDPADAWSPQTFKIKLEESPIPSINWIMADRTLVVKLQKGFMLKMSYACFWRPKDLLRNSALLPVLGISNLSSGMGQKIARGQHWLFSPFRDITFVHATQTPVDAPLMAIKADRNFFDTHASLNTLLKLHGPSTDKLDIEANWTEWTDDPINTKKYETSPMSAKVFHFSTLYAVYDYQFGNYNVKNNPFGPIPHQFNDTKHRMVNYKAIASTRYREYFSTLLKSNPNLVITKESPAMPQVNILSSARPSAPQVEYVVPIFEWGVDKKGNTLLKGRGCGLRVYLKRPWYSSGEGEQLAVVLFSRPGVPEEHQGYFTTWGKDPTVQSGPLPGGAIGVTTDVFVNPDAIANNLSMVEQKQHLANIAAYTVHYDDKRELYYADIMINFGLAYSPFVRLALARYQSESVKANQTDCCLSPVVRTDYVQIQAPRATSLEYKNGSKTNIVVAISGTVPSYGSYDFRNRFEILIDPIVVPMNEGAYMSVGDGTPEKHIDSEIHYLNDVKNFAFYHAKEFNLPSEWAGKPYRIRIMEYEMLAADPLRKVNDLPYNPTMASTPMRSRLVFSDVYEVNV